MRKRKRPMPHHIKELSATESVALFRALASESRARILELLSERDMNINELSAALKLAQPSITKHVQILEEAGLVASDYLASPQGTQKRCRRMHDRIIVDMTGPHDPTHSVAEIEMPIGMYSIVSTEPTCGLATRDKIIGLIDSPLSFHLPERANAELLWSSGGFIEYTFANTLPLQAKVNAVDVVMEVSSEAPGYDNNYPSDLTMWINGVEIGTWTCPGDFGGVRGRLNPSWWPDNMNQSGLLKVWRVDRGGASVDGVDISTTKIDQLNIQPWNATSVRLGVKDDAKNAGGFTLFGKGFGNYEMGLVMRLDHGTPPSPPAGRSRR
ncbi:ArsR family transcriptional regulator [bacterium]|nr:MAG: ArsR family transcriptional regulator [bacterium]